MNTTLDEARNSLRDEELAAGKNPDVEETDRGRRGMDSELRTMAAMLRLLDDLSETARPRVVAWLQSRFLESKP